MSISYSKCSCDIKPEFVRANTPSASIIRHEKAGRRATVGWHAGGRLPVVAGPDGRQPDKEPAGAGRAGSGLLAIPLWPVLPASGPCAQGGSLTAGPDGRRVSVPAPMSPPFGALSLAAQRECSPKRAPARRLAGGAEGGTGHIARYFGLRVA